MHVYNAIYICICIQWGHNGDRIYIILSIFIISVCHETLFVEIYVGKRSGSTICLHGNKAPKEP